ncbi:MAG: helix-hairpin-helix domain-containing protein [Solirubrobacterales bacterium]|nr:helix-hairpin-helix domain-containing protein [Solirubrobacterales bacterium]
MGNWDRGTVLIWGACALLVLGLGGRWLLGGRSSSGNASTSPRSAGSPGSVSAGAGEEQAPTVIVVHVVGAVRHPGVFRLRAGVRVYEAVRAAGGSTRGADESAVDLAAKALDGSQILIPLKGQPSTSAASGGSGAGASGGPVSLSSAKAEDLDALDGIGPALAARIIEWRQAHGGFKSVGDLDQVSGIGPAKLAALRSHVVP